MPVKRVQIILKRGEQEQRAKLKALRTAIDEGNGSGVASGDPFERVLERLRREDRPNLE